MTADPSSLEETLAGLEAVWRRFDLPIARLVQPGISEREVRRGLADVGLEAPDDLVTWFGWHNGLDFSSRPTYREAAFAPPDWCLVSLEQAIATYKMSQESYLETVEWADGMDISSWVWTPDLFPVADSIGPDTIVVSCAGTRSAPAKVTVMGKEGRNQAYDFVPSLSEAVGQLLHLIDAGEYSWANPGWVGDQFALGDSPLF